MKDSLMGLVSGVSRFAGYAVVGGLLATSGLAHSADSQSLLRSLPSLAGAQLQGIDDRHDTQSWRGIPFAEPPVGELRWRAPRDPVAWQGLRDAAEFGSICAQRGSFFGKPDPLSFGQPIGSEDCLYLNVWRPDSSADNLPVLFWIHGGSNVKGAGSEHLYNGAAFANSANAVVVTVNYRLSSFGWFLNDSLADGDAADGSGNYATLDLIKGLQWVEDNITAFGGDPNSVTLAGQSAGCINAWGLLQSPLAKNLVDRMLCSSGLQSMTTKNKARQQSDEVVDALLVDAGYAATAIEAASFRRAQTASWLRSFMRALPMEKLVAFSPTSTVGNISDGHVLPAAPFTNMLLGNYNKVPMLLGSSKDEGTFFVAASGFFAVSDAELWDMVNYQAPASLAAADVIKPGLLPLYRPAHKVLSLALDLSVDNIARKMRLLQGDVYRYNFTWDDYPEPWREVFGAMHGIDLPFLFGNFLEAGQPDLTRMFNSAENQSQREALSENFIRYVAQFMRNGDPNRLYDGLPYWYDWSNIWLAKKRLVLDSTIYSSRADFWLSDVEAALSGLDSAQRAEVMALLSGRGVALEDADVEYH